MNHSLTPSRLLCEFTGGAATPTVNTPAPIFSWAAEGSGESAFQTAFELRVSSAESSDHVVWNSGKISSANPFKRYAGSPLIPNSTYFWKVRLWDALDQPGPFSEPRRFHTDGLDEKDFFKTARSMVTRTSVSPVATRRTGPNSHFIDFGRDAFANLAVTLDADEEKTIEIHLGEVLDADGSLHVPEPRSYECSRRYRELPLTVTPGRKTYTLELPKPFLGDDYQPKGYNCGGERCAPCPEHTGELMPFRYCEIKGWEKELGPGDVVQLATHYPFNDEASSFVSSNDNLNEAWDFCKYSIKATTPFAVYVDGDRERVPYEGDALINQWSHYCCESEYSLARNTLRYFLENMGTWPYEWALATPIIARSDYFHTGDADFCGDYYDRLVNTLFLDFTRDDGLLVTREIQGDHPIFNKIKNRNKLLRCVIDWPPNLRDDYEIGDVNTVPNCFFHRALNAMADIASALGKTADAERFLVMAERLKHSIREKLLDHESGLFIDNEESGHSSSHANAHAVSAGLAKRDELPTIMNFLESKGMACGVWGAQFLLEALCLGGAENKAIELMASEEERSWLNMLKQGATITMECWTNELKPAQDWNHPWATAPLNVIAGLIMGIRPKKPGFSEVLIQPRPGRLESASITYPSVRGDIHVAFENDADHFKLDAWIPGNMKAEARLPAVLNGKPVSDLRVDGIEKAFEISEDVIIIEKIPPGKHVLLAQ